MIYDGRGGGRKKNFQETLLCLLYLVRSPTPPRRAARRSTSPKTLLLFFFTFFSPGNNFRSFFFFFLLLFSQISTAPVRRARTAKKLSHQRATCTRVYIYYNGRITVNNVFVYVTRVLYYYRIILHLRNDVKPMLARGANARSL